MEVKINKEIRNYTESMFFGLSMRQFIFSVLAVSVAVEAVLKTGRTACKVCNPPSTVEKPTRKKQRKVSARTVKSTPPPDVFTPLTFIANKDELRTVNRQKAAARERAKKLREGLSQDELNSIYALTQPRYAFWAAKGHKHFHLRSCPTMC